MARDCIICQKQIELSEHNEYQNGAVHCVVRVGYGSQHDLTQLDFVICDDCMSECIDYGYVSTKWHDPFTRELFDTQEELDDYHLENTRELFRKNPAMLESLKREVAERRAKETHEVKTAIYDVHDDVWYCPSCGIKHGWEGNEIHLPRRVECACGKDIILQPWDDRPLGRDGRTRLLETVFYCSDNIWCHYCGHKNTENKAVSGAWAKCICRRVFVLVPISEHSY